MKREQFLLDFPGRMSFVQEVRAIESEMRGLLSGMPSPRHSAAAQAVAQAMGQPGILVRVGCVDSVELVDVIAIVCRMLSAMGEVLDTKPFSRFDGEVLADIEKFDKDRDPAPMSALVGRGLEVELSNGSAIRLHVDAELIHLRRVGRASC
jgi:hypothetical protein